MSASIRTAKIVIDKGGNLDLKKSLIKAKKLGFSRIFVEAGIKLSNSFFDKDLIDDFKLFISNLLLKYFFFIYNNILYPY